MVLREVRLSQDQITTDLDLDDGDKASLGSKGSGLRASNPNLVSSLKSSKAPLNPKQHRKPLIRCQRP